ncbi:MAG: exopolysaccharide biosynthesis polyprenyl glycosylphosphotransferase [Planctomycetota bacterium]|jgi:exopolysaccharide biosynthesis polyprenyl glycosylphosphotransferase
MSSAGTIARRHFRPLFQGIQVVLDSLVILVACWLAHAVMAGYESTIREPSMAVYYELWGLTIVVSLVVFHGFGMYRPVKSLLNVEEFKAIAKSTVVSFVIVVTLIAMLRPTEQESTHGLYGVVKPIYELFQLNLGPTSFSRLNLVVVFLLIGAGTSVSRFFSFRAIQYLHRRGIGNRNVLILGTEETALWLQRKFVLVPTLGLRFVGFMSEKPEEVGQQIEGSPVLGCFDDLTKLVSEFKVHEVFVALPESSEARVMEVIESLETRGIPFRVVPRFYHLMSQRVKIENLDSIPLISRPDRKLDFITMVCKRLLDLVFSMTFLLVLMPAFVLATILIRRQSEGPVFFMQTRIGKDGKPFRMFKFRTMYTQAGGDAPTPDSASDPRITPIGRFLRRYSLDELPQFINVLRGEMSIVGPRPEMPFIVEKYDALDRERLRAKPGITGLWQISSGRRFAIHQNLDYDIYYIENRSVLLDLVIIMLTVFAVMRGTGAH